MAGNCAHGIVGDTGGNCAADPGWVGEKRIEAAIASLRMLASWWLTGARYTYIVQVNVDSAKVVQNKVSNSISALDGVRVAVKGL